VDYPHIAVTYLPLACTGATIADGLFGSQRARECPPSKSSTTCQTGVNGQLSELRAAMTAGHTDVVCPTPLIVMLTAVHLTDENRK